MLTGNASTPNTLGFYYRVLNVKRRCEKIADAFNSNLNESLNFNLVILRFTIF